MTMQSILTVTTAATSYDLTTLTNVKAELNVTVGTSDTVLSRYISGASHAAMEYTNRVFQVETLSEQFLQNRRDRFVLSNISPLQLSRWPLITVTSVTEDGTVLVVGTDYLVDPVFGQLTRLDTSGFPRTWPSVGITVAYTAGYSTIPFDVEDAVIRMVTTRYSAKGRDPNLKQSSIPGVLEQSWWIATGTESGNMAPAITDILDNYRVPIA
jgi:uncharacterized phiE125 gp8 family phage protein